MIDRCGQYFLFHFPFSRQSVNELDFLCWVIIDGV